MNYLNQNMHDNNARSSSPYPNPQGIQSYRASSRQQQHQPEPKKPNYFYNKKIVITGASSGIGRCLAYYYLNNGAKVALVARDLEEMEQIGQQFPSQALVIKCDLTVDMRVFDTKNAIAEKFVNIDILINCAGALFSGDIETSYPQDFDYLCDLNVRAPFVLMMFFKDLLQKTNGCVINIGCDKGSRPEPGMIGYCMTKAGIEMLTKSSAAELAPLGIRVNAVSPSTTDTNLYLYAGLNPNEYSKFKGRVSANNPMQKMASDQEVAKAVIYLTSDQARKITGHILKVDGGKSLTSRGQVTWYGHKYMTKKFENDGSMINYNMKHVKTKLPPEHASQEEIDQFVESQLEFSRWGIRSDEAHFKQQIDYRHEQIDQDNDNWRSEQEQTGGIHNPKLAN